MTKHLAGELGFEPRLTESESAVLPSFPSTYKPCDHNVPKMRIIWHQYTHALIAMVLKSTMDQSTIIIYVSEDISVYKKIR